MVDHIVEEKRPPQTEYIGLKRELISWAPIIDRDKCDVSSCGGFCVGYCPFGVFEVSPDGSKAEVRNPNNCNVGDEACKWRCPRGAISFPPRDRLRAQLKSLRKANVKDRGDDGT
jgi:NAD-dependent dihydropyrimidine dehydrogenase PreA subunit